MKKLDTYIISMHEYYSLQRGELKITEVDFNKVLDELHPLYDVIAKTNDVAFDVIINQDEIFRTDEGALKLILNNLLSNAFKYQDKKRANKSVNVNVKVKDNTATIYVKDTGIGILGTHIGEIFNLFYRANSQEVGSGFGLYNVKSALLKLNGEIEVNSVMHQGTTFKITIHSI